MAKTQRYELSNLVSNRDSYSKLRTDKPILYSANGEKIKTDYSTDQLGSRNKIGSYNPITESRIYGTIGKTLEDTIGSPLQEVNDRFTQSLTDALYTSQENSGYLTRRESMDKFVEYRLKEGISKYKGNLAGYAREAFDVKNGSGESARRSMNRLVKKYDLGDYVDGCRPTKDTKLEVGNYILSPDRIKNVLTQELDTYKGVLHPQVFDDLHYKITSNSEKIAENISQAVGYMPESPRMHEVFESVKEVQNIKEAKRQVEKQFVTEALVNAEWDIKKAAKYLGDSRDTVQRKIIEHGIKKESLDEKLQEGENIKSHTQNDVKNESTKSKNGTPKIIVAQNLSEIDRLKEIIDEKNSRGIVVKLGKNRRENRQVTPANMQKYALNTDHYFIERAA